MDSGQLLSRLKEASNDDGVFTTILSSGNEQLDQKTIQSAKWLESEMYIRLKKCEVQKAVGSEGVFISVEALNSAIGFYKHYDFRVIGRQSDYYNMVFKLEELEEAEDE